MDFTKYARSLNQPQPCRITIILANRIHLEILIFKFVCWSNFHGDFNIALLQEFKNHKTSLLSSQAAAFCLRIVLSSSRDYCIISFSIWPIQTKSWGFYVCHGSAWWVSEPFCIAAQSPLHCWPNHESLQSNYMCQCILQWARQWPCEPNKQRHQTSKERPFISYIHAQPLQSMVIFDLSNLEFHAVPRMFLAMFLFYVWCEYNGRI